VHYAFCHLSFVLGQKSMFTDIMRNASDVVCITVGVMSSRNPASLDTAAPMQSARIISADIMQVSRAIASKREGSMQVADPAVAAARPLAPRAAGLRTSQLGGDEGRWAGVPIAPKPRPGRKPCASASDTAFCAAAPLVRASARRQRALPGEPRPCQREYCRVHYYMQCTSISHWLA